MKKITIIINIISFVLLVSGVFLYIKNSMFLFKGVIYLILMFSIFNLIIKNIILKKELNNCNKKNEKASL